MSADLLYVLFVFAIFSNLVFILCVIFKVEFQRSFPLQSSSGESESCVRLQQTVIYR